MFYKQIPKQQHKRKTKTYVENPYANIQIVYHPLANGVNTVL